jgi:predicted transcriptional regulator
LEGKLSRAERLIFQVENEVDLESKKDAIVSDALHLSDLEQKLANARELMLQVHSVVVKANEKKKQGRKRYQPQSKPLPRESVLDKDDFTRNSSGKGIQRPCRHVPF